MATKPSAKTKPAAAKKPATAKAKDLPAKKDAKGGIVRPNHNETLVRA